MKHIKGIGGQGMRKKVERVKSLKVINDTWKLGADSLNVILYKKTGKSYRVYGYYAMVKSALKDLIDQEVRDSELVDLKTVVDRVDKAYADIEAALG